MRNHLCVGLVCVSVVCIGLAVFLGCLRESWPSDDARPRTDPAYLAELLGNDDPDVSFAARLDLLRKGKEAVPCLISALEGDNPGARLEAAAALAALRNTDRDEALPALVRACHAPDARLRDAAVQALASIGPSAAAALPAVRALVRDPDWAVSANAMMALVSIAGADAVPDLVEALRDPNRQAYAAYALGEVGPSAREAVGPLRDLAGREGAKPAIVAAATQALNRIGTGEDGDVAPSGPDLQPKGRIQLVLVNPDGTKSRVIGTITGLTLTFCNDGKKAPPSKP